MADVIPLKYGPIFKRVFSKPSIFREFVEAVTGVQVNVSQIHTEYEYPERVGNVNLVYDIFAEDTEQRVIIEIQHIKEEDFFSRFFYYHVPGIIQQVTSFEEYEPPKTVYTIVVLTSVSRDGSINFSWSELPLDVFDEWGDKHRIAPHRLIFVNPRLVNDDTPAAVKPWLEVIKDSLDSKIDESAYPSPSLQELIAEIQRNTMSAEESTAIKDESAWAKATVRFREEGRRDQQIATAKVMLSKDIDHVVIEEATGLSPDEISHVIKMMQEEENTNLDQSQ